MRWLLAERHRNKRSGVPAAGFRRFSAEDLADFGQEMFQGIAPAGNNYSGAALFRGTMDGNRDDLDAD